MDTYDINKGRGISEERTISRKAYNNVNMFFICSLNIPNKMTFHTLLLHKSTALSKVDKNQFLYVSNWYFFPPEKTTV